MRKKPTCSFIERVSGSAYALLNCRKGKRIGFRCAEQDLYCPLVKQDMSRQSTGPLHQPEHRAIAPVMYGKSYC